MSPEDFLENFKKKLEEELSDELDSDSDDVIEANYIDDQMFDSFMLTAREVSDFVIYERMAMNERNVAIDMVIEASMLGYFECLLG